MNLAKGHTPAAVLVANYRTTEHVAASADDAKLRASIVSVTRFALEGAAKAPNPDPAYAFRRCAQVGAALPTNVLIAPVPNRSVPTTCVTATVTAGSHTYSFKDCA
jgi:hypothetical protein